jgi:glycosyltransferase involved in cell wall biosynthesis
MASKLVTVGIPVWNEESYIRDTLNSVIDNIDDIDKVIISDNASSDNTQKICREFSQKNGKIAYIRQDKNIGSLNNFGYLLNAADSKYFMWLGGHDILHKRYIAQLKAELGKNADAVLAYTPAEHIGSSGESTSLYEYFFHNDLVSTNPFKRVCSLARHLNDCSLLHGLFKTEILRQSFVREPFAGCDLVLLCKAASLGTFVYTTSTKILMREIRKETFAESLERWKISLGEKAFEIPDKPYRRMQEGFIETVQGMPASKPTRAIWKLRTQMVLTRRFGPFTSNDGMMARMFWNGFVWYFDKWENLKVKTTRRLSSRAPGHAA